MAERFSGWTHLCNADAVEDQESGQQKLAAWILLLQARETTWPDI